VNARRVCEKAENEKKYEEVERAVVFLFLFVYVSVSRSTICGLGLGLYYVVTRKTD